MAIEKLRGTVQHITSLGKHGTKCRLDNYTVLLPQDLASSIRAGDDIEVAGTIKNSTLQAMAVKNFRQDKTSQVDVANYVFVIAVAGFLCLLCGILGLRAIGSGEMLAESVDDIVSMIGFIAVLLAVRHLFLINRASNQLKYP